MPQGKCTACKIRYFWPNKRVLVRNAHCPVCHRRLMPTSKNVNLPTKKIDLIAPEPLSKRTCSG